MNIKNFKNSLFKYLTGAVGYGCLEIICRGYTHISMLLLGGFCFRVLLLISKTRLPFAVKSFSGGIMITLSELLTGYMVNVRMGLDVWDYSAEAYHLNGQICARFTLLWCALSAIVMLVCDNIGAVRARLAILVSPAARLYGRVASTVKYDVGESEKSA